MYPDKEGYWKALDFIWKLQMVCFGYKEKKGAGNPNGSNDKSRGIKAKVRPMGENNQLGAPGTR